jgi:hypothetical protein
MKVLKGSVARSENVKNTKLRSGRFNKHQRETNIMMIRNMILTIAAFVLTGLIAFAQMGGMGGTQPQQGGMTGTQQPQQGGMMGGQQTQQGGMMGTQQSQQAMGSQMMRNNMMRDMSATMKQMNGMMQKMSNTMEHGNMNDQTHMQDMSQTMNEMSDIMKEMAGKMAEGKMDTADMKKLQDRMKITRQEMDRMAKEYK